MATTNAPVIDDSNRQPEEGMALCLSGGGYRAMVFHLGCLWRLNDAGLLGNLKRLFSVSGGSINSLVLGLAWGSLQCKAGPTGRREEAVIQSIREVARQPIVESGVR